MQLFQIVLVLFISSLPYNRGQFGKNSVLKYLQGWFLFVCFVCDSKEIKYNL